MEIVKRTSRLREIRNDLRKRGESIGFVPTMGMLHDGHMSLVRRAHETADRVVMSIFVNPTQFGPGEDFASYPRDIHRDTETAKLGRVDYLFLPESREVYPEGFRSWVVVEGLEDKLCGRSRPGHFRGVATVVLKLLNIVGPDFAFFGEKDYQQLVIIRRMVQDLNLEVEVVACPTVREPDGLAMSSRNLHLSAEERKAATVLYRSLERARRAFEEGERQASSLAERMRAEIRSETLARLEYAEVVDPRTLEPLDEVDGPALCAVAAHVGRSRLIDNVTIGRDRPAER